EDALPGKINYLIGNDPANWRTNLSTYRKVRYREVYPGIDLVFYGNQRQLEFDFAVAPGAEPERIRFTFAGAEKVELDANGNLVLETGDARMIQRAPKVYQNVSGERREIHGGYVLEPTAALGLTLLDGDEPLHSPAVRFRLASYDPTKPLVIDPV